MIEITSLPSDSRQGREAETFSSAEATKKLIVQEVRQTTPRLLRLVLATHGVIREVARVGDTIPSFRLPR
jgi:hypothetical protein